MIKFLLDYSSGMPIYRQIIDQIRFGIASGQLKLGEQLPTVRDIDCHLLQFCAKTYIVQDRQVLQVKHPGNLEIWEFIDDLL